MQLEPSLNHQPSLEMPEGFDPSGVPCSYSRHLLETLAPADLPLHGSLPGLPRASVIASVEEVTSNEAGDWLAWGSAFDRPILFAVEPDAAAEMMNALAAGGSATAIVEPWQVLVERLD